MFKGILKAEEQKKQEVVKKQILKGFSLTYMSIEPCAADNNRKFHVI